MKRVMMRVIGTLPGVFLQALWMFVLIRWLSNYATLLNFLLSILAVIFVLYIFGTRFEGSYKTLWLLLILGFPILGTTLYLVFGNKKYTAPLTKRLNKAREDLGKSRGKAAREIMEDLREDNPRLAATFDHVQKTTNFPLRRVETAEYFPLGELMFERMLEDLKKAEKFIYAEYFILEEGVMWNSMVDIMAEKAAQGVAVRVLYDDIGSIGTYSVENVLKLQEKNIECIPFNPFVFVKGTLNYRDHRKMLIIDGEVAYSGGVNLADEYINQKERFGHWKDIGFRLTGAPVENYMHMFAEFWNAFASNYTALPLIGKKNKEKTMISLPEYPLKEALIEATKGVEERAQEKTAQEKTAIKEMSQGQEKGYVLSYFDSPGGEEAISNSVFVELLSQAVNYAWFYTPYLLLGDELLDAFVRAANRGVDVRIIMPGIPDKKLIFRMSRGYYYTLMNAGVKIFEYTPGFVHAKASLVDDVIGTVGTVNLDYRSLFLHFENNSLFYKAEMLADLKDDFEKTMAASQERTIEDLHMNFWRFMVDSALRILSPLC